MADTKSIESKHPLFHLVFSYAFDQGEKWALDIALGKECAEGDRQAALESSVLNLWTSVALTINRSPRSEKDIDYALAGAARAGNIDAMRLARDLGARYFNMALENAAAAGQADAMGEARRMGATDLDSALEIAASEGQPVAVKVALAMGALATDDALANAAKKGHISIMRELVSAAITQGVDLDFDQALYCAAAEGEVDAMREALAMGRASDQPLNLNNALADAARYGHLAAVKEAIAMGAKDIGQAFDAARAGVQLGECSCEVVDYLRALL